jgi:hypothetical protein
MTVNTEPPDVPPPAAERADLPTAAGARFTLTTPATLPADVDVRIEEPPIAPTAFWKTCWQDAGLQTRFHDALTTLTDETYQSAWSTLVDDWGVTAPANSAAPTYAAYLLDGLQHPSEDRWFESVRVTRQLGAVRRSGILNAMTSSMGRLRCLLAAVSPLAWRSTSRTGFSGINASSACGCSTSSSNSVTG